MCEPLHIEATLFLRGHAGRSGPLPFYVIIRFIAWSGHEVIADHFPGPNLAAVTGLHYTSSVLGPLVGPAAFGYSVDFWNSDLIASCVAAACLVAAGYFFGAKPPRIPLRRASISWPRSARSKMPDLTSFSNGRPFAMPAA